MTSARRYRSQVAELRRAERGRQPIRDRIDKVIASIAAGPPPATLPDPTKETDL